MKNTVSTAHGLKRAKERMGCNEKKATRMIELAISRGKHAEDYKSRERSFLEHLGENNCFAVVYNKFCYIINEFDACVTLYPVPAWFEKKNRYKGKEKIRNFKAYSKMYNTI